MTKDTLRNELEISLKKLLRDVKFEAESLSPDMDPLLLLVTMKPHIIGFAAFFGDSPSNEYHRAYENFKKIHSAKAKERPEFDFELVMCHESMNGEHAELFNSIELDPYFCRKY